MAGFWALDLLHLLMMLSLETMWIALLSIVLMCWQLSILYRKRDFVNQTQGSKHFDKQLCEVLALLIRVWLCFRHSRLHDSDSWPFDDFPTQVDKDGQYEDHNLPTVLFVELCESIIKVVLVSYFKK